MSKNTLSSILKDYDQNFIKDILTRLTKISFIGSMVFTIQVGVLSIFYPSMVRSLIIFCCFSLLIGLSYYISIKRIKYAYEISTFILFVGNFSFVNSLVVLGNLGSMGVFNPSINYIFMMFISLTMFSPSFITAVIHSFSYATCATLYYLYGFQEAHEVLNKSWYNIETSSLYTFPLAYYMSATVASVYVWYRSKKHSNLRNIVYKSLLTSTHEKLISEDTIDNSNWYILTAIINLHEDFFGGDFIASRHGDNYIEVFIGDVVDHGINTSQVAFGLLSIFHSSEKDTAENILLNCHRFLLRIGEDLGGLAYISLIRFLPNGSIHIWGSTGVNPQLVDATKITSIKTENLVFGSPDLNLKELRITKVKLKKSNSIIIKTDGWTSEYDDKASIIATYN